MNVSVFLGVLVAVLVVLVRLFMEHEKWMSFAMGVFGPPATVAFTWLLFAWGDNRVLTQEGCLQDALRLCIIVTLTGVPCCMALHEWRARKLMLERLERRRARSD